MGNCYTLGSISRQFQWRHGTINTLQTLDGKQVTYTYEFVKDSSIDVISFKELTIDPSYINVNNETPMCTICRCNFMSVKVG